MRHNVRERRRAAVVKVRRVLPRSGVVRYALAGVRAAYAPSTPVSAGVCSVQSSAGLQWRISVVLAGRGRPVVVPTRVNRAAHGYLGPRVLRGELEVRSVFTADPAIFPISRHRR
jgi:hypothetical protein